MSCVCIFGTGGTVSSFLSSRGVILCMSLGEQRWEVGIMGFRAAFVPVVVSQSVVPLPAASASPGNILQMPIFSTPLPQT